MQSRLLLFTLLIATPLLGGTAEVAKKKEVKPVAKDPVESILTSKKFKGYLQNKDRYTPPRSLLRKIANFSEEEKEEALLEWFIRKDLKFFRSQAIWGILWRSLFLLTVVGVISYFLGPYILSGLKKLYKLIKDAIVGPAAPAAGGPPPTAMGQMAASIIGAVQGQPFIGNIVNGFLTNMFPAAVAVTAVAAGVLANAVNGAGVAAAQAAYIAHFNLPAGPVPAPIQNAANFIAQAAHTAAAAGGPQPTIDNAVLSAAAQNAIDTQVSGFMGGNGLRVFNIVSALASLGALSFLITPARYLFGIFTNTVLLVKFFYDPVFDDPLKRSEHVYITSIHLFTSEQRRVIENLLLSTRAGDLLKVNEVELFIRMHRALPQGVKHIEYNQDVIDEVFDTYPEDVRELAEQLIALLVIYTEAIESGKEYLLENLGIKGVLIYGPPGTGKSHFYKNIYKALGLNPVSLMILDPNLDLRGRAGEKLGLGTPSALARAYYNARDEKGRTYTNMPVIAEEIEKALNTSSSQGDGGNKQGNVSSYYHMLLDPKGDAMEDRYLYYSVTKPFFVWATTNYAEQLPEAVIDRFICFFLSHIPREYKKKIAREILVPLWVALLSDPDLNAKYGHYLDPEDVEYVLTRRLEQFIDETDEPGMRGTEDEARRIALDMMVAAFKEEEDIRRYMQELEEWEKLQAELGRDTVIEDPLDELPPEEQVWMDARWETGEWNDRLAQIEWDPSFLYETPIDNNEEAYDDQDELPYEEETYDDNEVVGGLVAGNNQGTEMQEEAYDDQDNIPYEEETYDDNEVVGGLVAGNSQGTEMQEEAYDDQDNIPYEEETYDDNEVVGGLVAGNSQGTEMQEEAYDDQDNIPYEENVYDENEIVEDPEDGNDQGTYANEEATYGDQDNVTYEEEAYDDQENFADGDDQGTGTNEEAYDDQDNIPYEEEVYDENEIVEDPGDGNDQGTYANEEATYDDQGDVTYEEEAYDDQENFADGDDQNTGTYEEVYDDQDDVTYDEETYDDQGNPADGDDQDTGTYEDDIYDDQDDLSYDEDTYDEYDENEAYDDYNDADGVL